MTNYFNKDAAESYDEKNSRLGPIGDNMHFLIRLLLQDVPENARVLCVGVGTGAEILSLSKEHPTWSFVGVDPSEAMLEVCRERLISAGVIARTELIHGYVEEMLPHESFDVVLSVLVGHFVQKEQRVDFYSAMYSRLKAQGYFIDTEISFDLDSKGFPSMFENWSKIQLLLGATPESLKNLPEALKSKLAVLSPAETERSMITAGFCMPVRFFQSFMIIGWYIQKS